MSSRVRVLLVSEIEYDDYILYLRSKKSMQLGTSRGRFNEVIQSAIVSVTIVDPNKETTRYDFDNPSHGRVPIQTASDNGESIRRQANLQRDALWSVRSRQDSSQLDDSSGHHPTGQGDTVH